MRKPWRFAALMAMVQLAGIAVSSIIWIKRPGIGLRPAEKLPMKFPATGPTSQNQAIRMAAISPHGQHSPSRTAKSYILATQLP